MRPSTIFVFAFFLFLYFIPDAGGRKFTAPGPFALSVSIPAKSVKIIRRWMSKGGKTRLNLRPKFSAELGLPKEAVECRRNKTETDASSGHPGLDDFQLIFDWCRWEWNIKGRKIS